MTQSRAREEVSKQWLFPEAFYEMLLFLIVANFFLLFKKILVKTIFVK